MKSSTNTYSRPERLALATSGTEHAAPGALVQELKYQAEAGGHSFASTSKPTPRSMRPRVSNELARP